MRIRTIKPEFFTHEELHELELETKLPVRLAFIGLWCAADREGRFKWEPRRLGIQIIPYDKVDFAKILDALQSGGFIIRYGDNNQFGFIPSFLDHQHVNVREAKSSLPEFSLERSAPAQSVKWDGNPLTFNYNGVNIQPRLADAIMDRDGAKCCRCSSVDDLTIDHIFPQSMGGTHAPTNLRVMCRSCNSARPVAGKDLLDDLAMDGFSMDDMQRICMHVHARGEGKGREGNKEGKGRSEAEEFQQAWNESTFPKIATISPGRLKSINARFSEPFFQDNWKAGILKASKSDFCNGKNDRNWRADPDWFLRPDTLAKIMEGKYDNKTSTQTVLLIE